MENHLWKKYEAMAACVRSNFNPKNITDKNVIRCYFPEINLMRRGIKIKVFVLLPRAFE